MTDEIYSKKLADMQTQIKELADSENEGRRMSEIETKIKVDTQELEDARELIEDVSAELRSVVPNITIRNNQNVYVTINNFNETETQWAREEHETD